MATSGGGEDGFVLLETFIKAAAGAFWEGVVVAGPFVPEKECLKLQHLAEKSGIAFYAFVTDLGAQFGAIDALVCKGGYNTLAEAVSKGTPTVCVPRSTTRKEQLIRAQAFAHLGLIRMVKPDQLSVARLRWEVDEVLQLSRKSLVEQANAVLAFDGAHQAAATLLELAESTRDLISVVEEKTAL